MQPAQSLIQHLRSEVLQVDPEWSVDIRGGFSWWPHQQRQDIVRDRVRQTEDGTRLERVCVSTEVARLKRGATIPDDFISLATQPASVSGLIRRGDCLCLHAHAWVDESNASLYDMVLGLAAGLQIHEAAVCAAVLTKGGHAEPAFSGHRTNGLRLVPDEIANIVDTVIRPRGAGDPPWPADLFAKLREEYFDRPPCLLATSDEQGLTAEFPFGTDSSIVLASTSDEHPSFGRGLLVRNGFHIDSVDPALIADPITLNEWEVEQGDVPFFGSWTQAKDGRINFVTFVPNAHCNIKRPRQTSSSSQQDAPVACRSGG